MTSPRRPAPEVVPGTPSHRLIRGVMRMAVKPRHVDRVVLYRGPRWTISLIDSGDGEGMWTADGDTTIHMLWQMDERNGWADVKGDRFPIVPGDTMSVPGGSRVRLAGRMLFAHIEGRGRSLERVLPPSHGEESFEGYNRRTGYETPPDLSLERWKITQPLTVPASGDDYLIVDLAEPLALAWRGGTDLIGRGECRVIDSETGEVTLLPDGLGYALIVH